jgi:hypothetical protein
MALLLWLMPLGLVLALALRSGLFEVRYLLLGMPGLVLLSALGTVRLTRWPALAAVATAALSVPAASALQAQYFDPALARDDYRSVVADILRDARPDDAIVLTAPNQTEVFAYYYRGPLPTFGLPLQRPLDPTDTLRRLEDLKQHYGRVWYVDWASREADPQGLIPTWLADNGFPASHGWYGGVQLSLIALAGVDASAERVDLALDNGVNLDAYQLGSRSLKAGDTLALTLVWRAPSGPTTQRWKVFTHLLDANSNVVAQRDAEPADALKPTTTWAPGERVEDRYGIAVPGDLAPGAYVLEIGMYAGEQRAHFPDGANHLVLGEVQVTR